MARASSLPPLNTKTLLALALPSAAFTVLTNGFRVVDQYFIQRVSTEAQAAIGASVFVIIFFYASFSLISAGAGPLVARATGAGDSAGRRAVVGTSLAGASVLAVLVTVFGVCGAPLLTSSLGLTGIAADQCIQYLTVLSWTILPLVLTPTIDQSLIAMGNAKAPMVLHGVSLGLNIVLTPLLIDHYGIAGAALASNFARAVATAIGVLLVSRIVGLRWQDIRISRQLIRVMRIGAPMAMGVAAYALVYWAMLKTAVSPLGPHVNAALGIGFSGLEGVTWPVFHGLSLAVASLVGRYLGAGRPDLARAAVRLALWPASVGGIVASVVFFFGGEWLTQLFTDDPAVHHAAVQYAKILAFSQLPLAWETLSEGCLSGAGDTKTVFWFSAPINALRIPLAWIVALPLGFEAAGIWWVINATTWVKAALKANAVRNGKWATLDP